MKLLKTASLAILPLLLAGFLHSQSIVQTEADYLVLPATSYSSATAKWSSIPDKATSSSIADNVLVFWDTGGADTSTANNVGTSSDTLSWTLDFTNAAEYSVFIRVQGEFYGSSTNDSMFYAKGWNSAPSSTANSLGSSNLSVDYQWVRLTYSTPDPALGSGVESYSMTGADWILNINSTQAAPGNTVTYSIAGREGDLQIDGIAFHTDPSVSALELDEILDAEINKVKVQTHADYLIIPSTSFSTATSKWSFISDKTNSTTIADLGLVFWDTGGVDTSTTNSVGSTADTLSWTLDFNTAADYSVFIRVQGEFLGSGNNDSIFIAKDWNSAPTSTANSLGTSSLAVDYQWVRLTFTTPDSSLGAGVGSYSKNGADWVLTIDSTQALPGNIVTYAIAGRESDLQLDGIAFHSNPSVSASELNALYHAEVTKQLIETQTNPDFLVFPARSYDSATSRWSSIPDKSSSASIMDEVMVFWDTDGADDSAANNVGTNSDALSWTLDFTNADDYSMFIRVQGEFLGNSLNDSIFIAKDWDSTPTSIANSLGTTSLAVDYHWVRLTYSTPDSALGAGVESFSHSGSDWVSTIDSTEAVPGNRVTYSIAGREGDLQIDGIAFHTDPSVSATELDAILATTATRQLVEALPETSPAERVKKAVLQVAVERAYNAQAVSLFDERDALILDVNQALTQNAADFIATDPNAPVYLPINRPLITAYENNPYLQALVLDANEDLTTEDIPWPRALTVNGVIDSTGTSRAASKLMTNYVWLFGHEESPMKFDPELLKRFLRRAHAFMDSYEIGPDIYGDPRPSWIDQFACKAAFPALWEIRSLYPGLLLPGQLARWDSIMEDIEIAFMNYDSLQPDYIPWNINIETGRVIGGLVAGLWTENSDLQDYALGHTDATTARVLPDGGFPYHGFAQASSDYHNELLEMYLIVYELTGWEHVADAMIASQWKGPVMGRTEEFWSSPFYKTYRWNYENGTEAGSELVATMTQNPYVATLLDRDMFSDYRTPGAEITYRFQAPWYDASVASTPLPDNYTIADRNSGGPRGWYGNFNYAGAFRPNPSSDSYEGHDYEGHETLMGAMTVDGTDGRVNSILVGVTPRIWQTPEPTGDFSAWASLTVDEIQATTISQNYSVSTSIHGITRVRSDYYRANVDSGWTSRQMWIGMEDRIVGLVSTVPTASQAAAYAVNGVLRLISGGTAGAATTKVLQEITADEHYRYGELDIFVHDSTYTSLTGFEVPYRVSQYPATELTFSNRASEPLPVGSQATFPGSTEFRFVVEVRPTWTTTDLTDVNVLGDQDVIGLEVISAARSIKVWLNAAGTTQTVALHRETLPSGVDSFVLSDGVLGRIPFNPTVPSSVNLGAGQHAVIVVSSDADDHGVGWESFEQMIESGSHSLTTVTQTNSDYLVFDATSIYSAKSGWTFRTDKTTSPSIADQVMIFSDTAGVDDSASNLVGSSNDTLTWKLDFSTADDYSLFVRVQGEFGGNALNDSIFVAKDWDTAPTSVANSLGGSTSIATAYRWVRISNTTTGDPLGSGVESYAYSGSFGPLTINGTQALSGNTVTYSIAGRESDLQIDQIVFHTNPSISAAALDAIAD